MGVLRQPTLWLFIIFMLLGASSEGRADNYFGMNCPGKWVSGMMCQCPDGSFANMDLSSGQIICPHTQSLTPVCPAGSTFCPTNGNCCTGNSYCSEFGCVPPGTVSCGNYACGPGSKCSSSGSCISEDAVDCGNGSHCPEGNYCAQDSQHCFSIGSIDCGSYSCPAGNKCASGRSCIDMSAVDCGNGRYCAEGHQCARNGCVEKGTVDCGNYTCGPGSKCASGNRCIDRGDADCGTGRSCPAPRLCVRGGAECLTAADLEERRIQEQLRRLATRFDQPTSHSSSSTQKSPEAPLKLPKGPIGQIESPSIQSSPSTQPAKNPHVFEKLAGPAVVKFQGEPPQDILTLPHPDEYHANAVAVGTAEIIGYIRAGKSGALKTGEAVGKVVGIYGAIADGQKTLNDLAQKKDQVTIAHDVERDMWDIINAASPLKKLKPMTSVGAEIAEKKATAAAEGYLTDLLYEAIYKPKPSSSGGAR